MKKKNNLKRFIAGLVSSAMVMASFVFQIKTVKADDIINTSTPVSLTIHKYETIEQTDNPEITDKPGTGLILDNNKIEDEGYAPLQGVTFTMYKIANINQIDGDDIAIKYTAVDGITDEIKSYIEGDLDENLIEEKFFDDDKNILLTNGFELPETGVDGTTTFTGDGSFQGLYLVVETDKPAKVTEPVKPFIVSLPTTINGEWEYNVHAYPKNSTTTNSITIKKAGKVAGIAGTHVVENATFYLQIKEGGAWKTIKNNANGGAIGDANGLITISDGDGVKIDALAPSDYRFIEVSAELGYIVESDVSHEFTIKEDGTITGDEVSGTTLTVVNDKPTIKKEVLKKSTPYTWAKYADYSKASNVLDEVISFKVTLTVPKSLPKLTTYKIVDTYSNLYEKPTNFAYKFYKADGTEVKNFELTNKPDTTTSSSEWSLDLITDKDRLVNNTLEIAKIEITYNTKLTDNAVIASTGNLNEVSLIFTNQVYTSLDDNNPVPSIAETTTEIEDKAFVYTFSLKLEKEFLGSNDVNLGAKFELYDVVTGLKIGEYTVNNKGSIIVDGLSNGQYKWVEIDTTSGYNLLKEPVLVEIKAEYNQTTGEIVDENAVITSVTVESKKGFSFPVTGGRGTIIFTITGLTLMIVAVCIFLHQEKERLANK